jgi:hypothetical protein
MASARVVSKRCGRCGRGTHRWVRLVDGGQRDGGDVLTAPGTDLRIVVYTAVPGSPDASKLELLRVAGTQALTF